MTLQNDKYLVMFWLRCLIFSVVHKGVIIPELRLMTDVSILKRGRLAGSRSKGFSFLGTVSEI